MQALLDSLSVIRQSTSLLFVLLACIAWGSLITFVLLKKYASLSLTGTALGALALAGWPLPLLAMALIFFILCQVFPFDVSRWLVVLAAALAALFGIQSVWRKVSPEVIVPFFIFLVIAFIRIGYAARAVLPSYFDSAWHYDLIKSIVAMEHGAQVVWPVQGYYHIGYHLITAGLLSMSGGSLGRLMLLFGQLTLACLPVPMIFYVRSFTSNRFAWIASVALAAFGWSMPAHAVDWGKYPALLAVLMLEFSIGTIMLRQKTLFAGSLLAAQLIHTRAIIVAGLAAFGWLASRMNNRWLAGLLLLAFAGESFLLYRDPILQSVLDPYLGIVSMLAMLLGALASMQHPRLTLSVLFIVAGLLAALFFPVSSFLTLLDKPLVQIMLFLPLSFLGGLGAGRLPKLTAAAAVAAILLNALTTQSLAPSACCILAGRDDMAAIDWIGRNLPEDARIAIATTDLRLAYTGVAMQDVGSDAGIWIQPLTGRLTVGLPFSTDFSRARIFRILCQRQITYLYVGVGERSFRLDDPAGGPVRYQPVFMLPQARVLRLQGCL